MTTFRTYMLRKAYENVRKNEDKLAEAEKLIDWEAFRPIIAPMYRNRTPRGGRPNVDEGVMVKLLVLQQWYGLSDPELERQVDDRISFQRFLGYPEKAPHYSTVWQFRERLAETGRDRAVWEELQRQLDEKGLKVTKGVVRARAGHVLVTTVQRVHVKMVFACFCFNLMQLGTLAGRP